MTPDIDRPPAGQHRPADIREACVEEAFRIVAEKGIEALSLREVARRLGVSHQAPYKHFASRDHILAEIIARAFAEFAAFLEGRSRSTEAREDLRAMGDCYMTYARENPLKYRLMFNTALPAPENHPGMMARARHAFDLLRGRLAGMTLKPLADGTWPPPTQDALFVWSTLHGLASILQADMLHTLGLSDAEIDAALGYCMGRLNVALDP